MPDDPEPDDPEPTEELREEQTRRARSERAAAEQAEQADDPEDALAHGRRAERAAYLASRLAERERSERDG